MTRFLSLREAWEDFEKEGIDEKEDKILVKENFLCGALATIEVLVANGIYVPQKFLAELVELEMKNEN